jgi:hypothetical protein
MAKNKRHSRVPVHNMADEPNIRLEDIVVDDIATAKAAADLAAEVEAEYDLITDSAASPEEAAPPLRSPAAPVEFAERLHSPDPAEELTGDAQDEIVIAMDELKEMAAAAKAEEPTECPTCKRPFVKATMNKEGEETKSSRIRRMAAEGLKKGEIAKALGISYQFVHNVLSRPTKTA